MRQTWPGELTAAAPVARPPSPRPGGPRSDSTRRGLAGKAQKASHRRMPRGYRLAEKPPTTRECAADAERNEGTSMADHTPYQRKIIDRYYKNFDAIKSQRLVRAGDRSLSRRGQKARSPLGPGRVEPPKARIPGAANRRADPPPRPCHAGRHSQGARKRLVTPALPAVPFLSAALSLANPRHHRRSIDPIRFEPESPIPHRHAPVTAFANGLFAKLFTPFEAVDLA